MIDAAAKTRSRADLGKAMAEGWGSIDKAKASITPALTPILTLTLTLTLTLGEPHRPRDGHECG